MSTTSKDISKRYGTVPIINASGTMTAFGASRICPEAVQAAADISGHFVSINELQAHASGIIAKATGAKGGFITSCSAAGVSLGVAACMTKGDLSRIERLPDTAGMNNAVVMQVGHNVNYGAAIEQSARVAGARIINIGCATEVNTYHLDGALRDNPDIVAALYVTSHHCVMEGMLSLALFTEICHAHKVPVIADMASEYDLHVVKDPGVDIAVYSAHKFIGGTTGGIFAAKTEALARAGYLQNRGIGRTMKIGKEGICGALAAIEAWGKRDHQADYAYQHKIVELWLSALAKVPGLHVANLPDWTGNPIMRVRVVVDPSKAGLHAWELMDRLAAADPRIFVREQFIERQVLVMDPCNLTHAEAQEVAARILAICTQVRRKRDGLRLSWDKYKQARTEGALAWPGPKRPARKQRR